MIDANQVLNQLTHTANGANRLITMIGAKNIMKSDEENSVSFKFMRGAKNKANYIKITLRTDDTYNIEFGKIHGMNYKAITTFAMVYGEDLKRIFIEETQLALNI